MMTAILCGAAAFGAVPALADAPAAAGYAIPAPPKGKGEVVFYRSNAFMGYAISCAVHEGDKIVSHMPRGHYVIVVTEPGKHAYSVESEAKDTMTVEVEPDEIQYASCHIKMGIMAGRPVLAPQTEAEFKATKDLTMIADAKMGEGALRSKDVAAALAAQAPAAAPAPVAAAPAPVAAVAPPAAPAAAPAAPAAAPAHP